MVNGLMNKQISITTDNKGLHGFLSAELPDGVRISISGRPQERRDLGVIVNIDINLVIDLAKIAKYGFAGFAAWLINRARLLKGNHKINIDSQQISVDDSEAIKLVTKKIESKK